MSFQSKLKVAGKEYNILKVNFGLAQETDATGRPSTITRGGKIELIVESTGETELFEWITNSFERKDGSIVFIKRDSDATLKELKFEEAYLVKYRENFDSTGRNPLTESFTLSARKISMGTGEHTNPWV
ncbi:MAG: type VI secretion system tube protein TssD [Moheibacter sp.]